MKTSNTRKKKSKRPDPLAQPPDPPMDDMYRPTSSMQSGMELDDVDLDMFSGQVRRQNSLSDSASSLDSDQMSMTGWKVKSQKRTWVTSPIVEEEFIE